MMSSIRIFRQTEIKRFVIKPSPNRACRRWGWLLAFACIFGLCLPLNADVGVGQSASFTVNTRFSGGISESVSGAFAVDTTGAALRSAKVAGRVQDAVGAGLPDVAVLALQNSVVRAQTTTDAAGNYTLDTLTPGIYLLRVEKANYLTALRYGVELAAGQVASQQFALGRKPAAPEVKPVVRPPEISARVVITSPQLKKYSNGRFTESAITADDRKRMSVVFTHGWRSDPDVWASDMAAKMISSGLTEANLLAWDWKPQAANPELGVALSSTPGQGEKLGQALAQALGGDYGLPIHFVGHSLGTLVNAAAANYLHEQKSGAFESSRTHLTLLDDAEVANIGGRLVTFGYTIPGLKNPLNALPSAAILGQVLSVGWVSPLPRERAWMDNYISLAGQLHNEAVNTVLVQAPERVSPATDFVQLHGYAARWYGLSVGAPTESDLGFRYSFEWLGTQAVFPSPSPYPLGTVFAQVEKDANELRLARLQSDAEVAETLRKNLQLVGLGVQRPADYAAGVAQTVGSAFVDLAMSFIPRPIEGTPAFTGTAMSTPAYFSTDDLLQSTPVWSLQFVLQSGPSSPLRQQSVSAQSLRALATPQPNQPACVWVPVSVPADAVVFCFDFTRSGEPKEDMFLASINGTNVFALESRFLPPDTRLNSGPIDVSRWAGKTVELFFGFVGGTAADATLKVDGLRFYGIEEQRLAAELAGNAVIISWPAALQGYLLEASDSLTGEIRWSVVAGSPALLGSRFAVTNSITSASRFYRLRKQ